MTIELTEEQRQRVVNGEPIRLNSPELAMEIVLVDGRHYQAIRDVLADEEEQKTILRYSMKQAATLAKENPY